VGFSGASSAGCDVDILISRGVADDSTDTTAGPKRAYFRQHNSSVADSTPTAPKLKITVEIAVAKSMCHPKSSATKGLEL
jgi:hypothetical protein